VRKKFILPVLCALFTACSSPLLEWIETEPDTSTQTGSGPETTPPPETGTTTVETTTILYVSSDKAITAFSFGFGDKGETDTIRLTPPSGGNGKTPIAVVLPAVSALPPGTNTASLTPTIEYIGKSISPGSGEVQNFSSPVTYRVTAENGSWRDYEVEVTAKTLKSAELKWFDLELPSGYMAEGVVVQGSPGTVTLHVPSGTNRDSLTAKVVQTGKSLTSPTAVYLTSNLEPEITLMDNFSTPPVIYTVKSEDDSVTKTYEVTVTVDQSTNTGIFDFQVYKEPGLTNPILNSHVVIGQKPRPDGKIPIIIQVPNGTAEKDMYAKITLSDLGSSIADVNGDLPDTTKPVFSGLIIFGPSNDREAVYTVTAENTAIKQDYVVEVSAGPRYYYVDGTNGIDDWPDYYNGGSQDRPFKTLAYAVQRAAKDDGIEKVLIMNDLNATAGGNIPSSSDGAFAIDLSLVTNKEVTIGTVGNVPRTLSAAGSGKRVLSIKGGADLTFENINITGGNNTAGNGGGIYVTGNSTVNFSGNITGNTAKSGGGVYVEGTGVYEHSQFNLTSGTISNNTAIGATAGYLASTPNDLGKLAEMDGGGGVYIKGNADFLLTAGGTISNNTTAGAGGGVFVNGDIIPGTPLDEHGLLMTGGHIITNETTSSTYPHGGGGVYVAHGAFDMQGGDITGNKAKRQGGGVFVHWGDAWFSASGSSTITGNDGTGSSKAICNRGLTALKDTTQADYVYIWDYEGVTPSQIFRVADTVKITTGIALAFSAGNKNFIEFSDNFTPGAHPAINIDLEGHLDSSGNFAGQLEPDWLGKTIIDGANPTLKDMLTRLNLNTFTGTPDVKSLANSYRIEVLGTNRYGTFQKK
jgi:hypothetical protein